MTGTEGRLNDIQPAPDQSVRSAGNDREVTGALSSLNRIERYGNMRGHLADAKRYLSTTFDELAEHWAGSPAERIGHYVLSQQGKMMRASITIASCSAVGGDPRTLTPVVGGIEYGHLASLMHDDLIDGDDIRRLQPTVWTAFGAHDAIITGDLLIFAAFYTLADCHKTISAERIVWALEAVARAGMDACFGTSMEMGLEGRIDISVETYLKMASGKAGSVFRGGSEGGSILGGGSAEQVAALRGLGDDLGIAFQIIDDILPYESDERTIGKPIFSDIRNRRPTLPVVLAAAECAEDDRDLLRAAFDDGAEPEDLADTHARMFALFERTGALTRAHRIADEYCDSALAHLSGLPANEGTEILHGLVQVARDRNA